MHTFELHRGTLPLLVSLPHNGVEIPEAVRSKLKPSAHGAPDTDWFVDRLYVSQGYRRFDPEAALFALCD